MIKFSIPNTYKYYINKLSVIRWVFLIIYTGEAVLKICAKGFFLDKYSYLRSGWNVLDFIIVVVGYVTEVISVQQEDTIAISTISGLPCVPTSARDLDYLAILRTFRILRAVKTISILPGF